MQCRAFFAVGCICGWLAIAASAAEPAELPPSHSVRPERYATGFEFAEGPVLDDAGNLFVVNYRGLGKIGRITPDGAAVYCDLRQSAPVAGRQPQANGLKLDRQGRLIVADAGGGRILRITEGRAAGPPAIETLADAFEKTPFVAPNDVALDRAGNVYFTDPGKYDDPKAKGAVYRYETAAGNRVKGDSPIFADTKIGTVPGKLARLDAGLAFPNGLAVAPDQKHLCVDESKRNRVLIYDLTDDGRATNRRTLIDFPQKTEGELVGGPFQPDGMTFDADGRLYVAMFAGGVVNVVEVSTGRLLRQYDAGGKWATNCHFHGGFLYVTVADREAVFRLRLGVEGFDYRKAP